MQDTNIQLLASGPYADQLLEISRTIVGNTHIVSSKTVEKMPMDLFGAQVFVTPLHELTAPVGRGLAIAALVAAYNPAIRIYVAPALQDKKMLGIQKKAKVYCQSTKQAIQLKDFRPDLTTEISEIPLVDLLAQEGCTAFLATEQCLHFNGLLDKNAHKIADWKHYEFNPVEFIPEAGQDVLALVTATADKATRRFLKPFHQDEISRKTNIERHLEQLHPDLAANLAAYCQIDANGYYQLHGMCIQDKQPKYAKASASSHLGLAEKVLGELTR